MAPRTIRSILVANRGEIAVRVLRTARALGHRTVAVYSDADRNAPHVAMADQAVAIGSPPVGESYLHIERILEAARESHADAIHPGYGFLSENADFARACKAQGITFIGPGPEAIELMGNKAAAKRRMIEAGVPCVPGYEGEDQADAAFERAAVEIGFPIMVKAAAGGGGRGMRLVDSAGRLSSALALARSEAETAFGSPELILEKALVRPRHVEIQILADAAGHVVHLGERDCSIQRRHQKVVEESPCPVLSTEIRDRMGAAAVEAARSIGYLGAGTVEFLLDTDGGFHFLEMNTRLQVEHPVTEMVTGLDLVALQIQVAEGEPLGLAQEDVRRDGHAIEVRLYAENPLEGFLPSTGRIDLWEPPSGDGVRVDAGIASGLEVSPFYDPMLAKIIAWGPNREIARRRLVAALRRTALFGPATNREHLTAVLEHEAFVAGEATTAFLGDADLNAKRAGATTEVERAAAAAAIQYVTEARALRDRSVCVSTELTNWSSTGRLATRYAYRIGDSDFDVTVSPRSEGDLEVQSGDQTLSVSFLAEEESHVELTLDGRHRHALFVLPEPGRIHLSLDGDEFHGRNRLARVESAVGEGGSGTVVAPMHGKLVEISVAVGDEVKSGDRLGVLEAMKMQHEILASVGGVVSEITRNAGDQVAAADPLLQIDVAERPADQENVG